MLSLLRDQVKFSPSAVGGSMHYASCILTILLMGETVQALKFLLDDYYYNNINSLKQKPL